MPAWLEDYWAFLALFILTQLIFWPIAFG